MVSKRPCLFILLLLTLVSAECLASSKRFHKKVAKIFAEKHYSYNELDDQKGKLIISNIIHSVDPGGLFLSRLVIKELNHTTLNKKTFESGQLYKVIKTLYIELEPQYRSFQQWIKLHPLEETKAFASGEQSYSNLNLLPRKERWTAFLSSKILQHHFDRNKEGLSFSDLGVNHERYKTILVNEFNFHLKRVIGSFSVFESLVLDVLAMSFDPHSNFFTSEGKKRFLQSGDKSSKGYGVYFSPNQFGDIEISYLDPRSINFTKKGMRVGNKVDTVTVKGQTYDMALGEYYKAMESLDSGGIDRVALEINVNGKRVKTVIEKSEISINKPDVFVVKESLGRIGYIGFRSFYPSSAEHPNGISGDIAKLVFKLERESIDAYLLDLRDNGGGDLREALRLIDIFVDQGPAFQVHMRGLDKEVIRLERKGMMAKHPVFILQNRSSASAAEIMASSLKERVGAIIIGEKSFGKRSMQNIFPIEGAKTDAGYLKLTVGLTENLSGTEEHIVGIQPDFRIPSLDFSSLSPEMDSIGVVAPKSKNLHSDLNIRNIEVEIKEKSNSRMKKNPNLDLLNRTQSLITEWEKLLSVGHPKTLTEIKKVSRIKKELMALQDQVQSQTNNLEFRTLEEGGPNQRYRDHLVGILNTDEELSEAYNIIYDCIE